MDVKTQYHADTYGAMGQGEEDTKAPSDEKLAEEAATSRTDCSTAAMRDQDAEPNMNDEEVTCAICLEALEERAVLIPCEHACFDHECIARWLDTSDKCPMCKQAVTSYLFRDTGGHGRYRRCVVRSEKRRREETSGNRMQRGRRRGRDRWRDELNSLPTSVEDRHLERRKFVYRHGLRARHVGSNRWSRFHNLSPLAFRRDARLIARLRTFLRRELCVFSFMDHASIEFTVEYIAALLRDHDIQSATVADLVAELVGRENAQILLHELHTFLRSPFENLHSYDLSELVQYDMPVPAAEQVWHTCGISRDGEASTSSSSRDEAHGFRARSVSPELHERDLSEFYQRLSR